MTRLVALAASTRTGSLNKRLLGIAVGMAEAAGATVTMLDYAQCQSALYTGESDVLPQGAAMVRDALLQADGLILASPEHNWSIPAALKNLIDWLSVDASAPLRGRAALLLCASPSVRGGIVGLQQLAVPLQHLGAHVYPQMIGIGEADMQMGNTHLAREKEQTFLQQCVADFVRITKATKGAVHA